ncbi:MAG: hypothetical protein Q9177_004130 [Variospora cf. flavescens]
MAPRSLIIELLNADVEPSTGHYQHVCSRVLNQPTVISDLVGEDQTSETLYSLTHHSARLVRLFREIFTTADPCLRSSSPLRDITTATIALLQKLIPLLRDIDVSLPFSLILPLIRPCMTHNTSHVRDLASVLVKYDDLVQRLVCEEVGARAIQAWAFSSNPAVRNASIQEAWTESLMKLVKACVIDHGLTEKLHDWDALKTAKSFLRQIQDQLSRSQGSPNLASMHNLSPQQRRSQVSERLDFHKASLKLPISVCDALQRLGIDLPSSPAKLEETIEELEGTKTLSILQAVATTMPCNWCRSALDHGEGILHNNTIVVESNTNVPDQGFTMDVFGQRVGIWDVLLSTPALNTLQERKRLKTAGSLEGKLITLAYGIRHDSSPRAGSKSMKRQLKAPTHVTRYEPGQYILWQVDLDEDRESRRMKQIIRVWAIVEGAKINTLLEHVIRSMQSTYSAEKRSRCGQKMLIDRNTTGPITFDESIVSKSDLVQAQTSLDVRSMNPNLLDLVDKFYAFTQPVLRSQIVDFMVPKLPYKLSAHEMEVVCYWKSASLILGRSGTGKTTCLMFKLVGKYLASRRHSSQRPIRQILLTRSPNLVEKLQIDIRDSIRALSALSVKDSSPETGNRRASQLDIPKVAVLSLKDDYYPIVCTYEDFLCLLENTAAIAHGQSPVANHASETDHEREAARSHDHQDLARRCVDFRLFKQDYWPKISTDTSRLPLSLVFGEIMGVIKGSASTSDTLEPLTLTEYLNASSRISPLFTLEVERAEVYQLFEDYEKLKRRRSEIDYVDRAINLLGAIRTDHVLQQMMASSIEELYIDEVQDHRCIDIALFLSLMRDSRGFHVAGDTAQAISQDATLRFADLKTLIFRHFAADMRSKRQKEQSQAETFQLGINYRSHHGIVGLAAFVMEILWKAFPGTVDKLVPEAGHLQGPLPLVFIGCGPEILSRDKDLSPAEAASGSTSFGADQIVLVRDEDAKKQLRSVVDNVGLTLTILQSKGMEFSDVKLFNFFSTCTDPGGLRRLPAVKDGGPAAFDCTVHAAMCSELKQLYVAITRARSRLFIIESSSDKDLAPVLQMLTTFGPEPLAKVVKRDDPSFADYVELLRTTKSSKPKDWIEKGWTMIARECYDEAIFCFEEADDQQGVKNATAKKEYAKGRALAAKQDSTGATSAYETAAALYEAAGLINDAVGVLRAVGWYERAAILLEDHDRYNEAAVLFINTDRFDKASVCYHKAGQLKEAANALFQGKAFDEYIEYVFDNRNAIPGDVGRTHEANCRLLLRRKKISKKHQKKAISLLGSPDEREKLYLRYEMRDALDEFYLENKRFCDLFRHRLQNCHLDTAFELLLRTSIVDELSGIPDEQIQTLIDHILVGRLTVYAQRPTARIPGILHDLQKVKHPRLATQLQQWNVAIGCIVQASRTTVADLGSVRDTRLRLITGLQVVEFYEQLLWFNTVFCNVTALYNRRIAEKAFQAGFLGRWWLERLVRELTWVSAFEQDDAVISHTIQRLRYDKEFAGVAAGIEALLLFRLKREWKERREYSILQEQLQLSTTLGVQDLFGRTLHYMTRSDNQGQIIWDHVKMVGKLESDVFQSEALTFVGEPPPAKFDNNTNHRRQHKDVGDFVQGINKINMEGLQSFHSITTLFECLATYIFVKICSDSFIIPQSWISMHLLRICCGQSYTKVTNPSDKLRYNQCLIELITSFCQILTRLNTQMDMSPKVYYVGQRSYPIGLLQQRNTEFLAVAHLNLGLGGGNFNVQKQTLEKVITAMQLRSMPQDIFPKGLQGAQNAIASLVHSTSLYNGKNPLTIVERRSVESPLTRQLCATGKLKSVKLSDLAPTNQGQQLSQQPPPAVTNPEPNHQLTNKQIESIKQLQKMQQHLCATSPKHRRIAHYQHLTASLLLPRSSRLCFRAHLISHGPRILSDLTDFQQRGSALRASISDAFAAATEASLPALEECLTRWESAQEILGAAARDMDDEKLKAVMMMTDGGRDDSDTMKAHLERVGKAVESASREMLDVEDVLLRDIKG